MQVQYDEYSRDPTPQQRTKQLGWWEYPYSIPVPSRKDGLTFSPSDLYKQLDSGKRRFDTLAARVKRCCLKHKGEYQRFAVRRYSSGIHLLGVWTETTAEVQKRLSRVARRDKENTRRIRKRQKSQLTALISQAPDVVRQALRQHDRELATRAVAAAPEEARSLLAKKKKQCK